VADRDRWRDEERYRRDEDERSRYGEHPEERRDRGGYGPDYGAPGGYGRESSSGKYRGGSGRDYGRREYSPSYGPGRPSSEPSRGYGTEGYGEDRGAYGDEDYGGRRSGSRYGREGYGGSGYGRGGYRGEERGWWERTSDEVASWFGDQEAERRRLIVARSPASSNGSPSRSPVSSPEAKRTAAPKAWAAARLRLSE